jgi:hypothetical protein
VLGLKWNPRPKGKAQWVQQAEAAGAFVPERVSKRVALLSRRVERAWPGTQRTLRLVAQITERTIDRRGQHLLEPEIDLQGWWATLEAAPEQVIEPYQDHGTHVQLHSESKTHNYNCLRLLRAASPWRCSVSTHDTPNTTSATPSHGRRCAKAVR